MIKFDTRNPSTLRSLLLGGAAAMAFTGFGGTALAQEADDTSAEDAVADDNVIIVQARRQAESLQEVPVTVTAIGAVVDQLGGPAAQQEQQEHPAKSADDLGHGHCVEHVAFHSVPSFAAMYPLPMQTCKV